MKVRTRKAKGRLTTNLARVEMPQIRKEHWQTFLAYARSRTSITEETVSPDTLKAVQSEFSQERVDAIPIEKLQWPILVSRDGYVLDGNHRWIKAGQVGVDVKVLRLGLDCDDALELMRDFPQSKFVENVFCDTGSGGGVDPTCSSDGQRSKLSRLGKLLLKERQQKEKEAVSQSRISKATTRLSKQENTDLIDKKLSSDFRATEFQRVDEDTLSHTSVPDEVGRVVEDEIAKTSTSIGQGTRSMHEVFEAVKLSAPNVTKDQFRATVLRSTQVSVQPWTGSVYALHDAGGDGELMLPRGGYLLNKKITSNSSKPSVNPTRTKMTPRQRRKLANNARKERKTSPLPSRLDPTGTTTLRRAMSGMLTRKFATLKGDVWKLVVEEDAFGKPTYAMNAFCPTGIGGGVDPSCSPASEKAAREKKVKDWLDWMDKNGGAEQVPEKDIREPTTSEHLRARESLSSAAVALTESSHDWEETRPWNADKNNLPKGFEYGSYGGRGQETAHHEDGKIVLTDKFFELHELGRQAVVYHELGHQLADTMVRDGTMFRLTDRGVFPKELNGQTLPHEILAEAYSLANVEPSYLQANAPFLAPYVRDRAVALRMPYLSYTTPGQRPTTNRFQFHSSSEKLAEFQTWLRGRIGATLTSHTDAQVWQKYTADGYAKGAGQAFDQVNKRRRFEPGKGELYAGSKSEFLRQSFGRPERVDKVKLLASRTFTDLKNVTEDMGTRMGRVLADGLVQGMHPRAIARLLDKELDLGRNRSEVVSRTELVRAHAEGSLDSYKDQGVEEVGAMVEFSTAGDDRVCPLCSDLEGKTFTPDKARGIIPVHPQCRCAWLPSIDLTGIVTK